MQEMGAVEEQGNAGGSQIEQMDSNAAATVGKHSSSMCRP